MNLRIVFSCLVVTSWGLAEQTSVIGDKPDHYGTPTIEAIEKQINDLANHPRSMTGILGASAQAHESRLSSKAHAAPIPSWAPTAALGVTPAPTANEIAESSDVSDEIPVDGDNEPDLPQEQPFYSRADSPIAIQLVANPELTDEQKRELTRLLDLIPASHLEGLNQITIGSGRFASVSASTSSVSVTLEPGASTQRMLFEVAASIGGRLFDMQLSNAEKEEFGVYSRPREVTALSNPRGFFEGVYATFLQEGNDSLLEMIPQGRTRPVETRAILTVMSFFALPAQRTEEGMYYTKRNGTVVAETLAFNRTGNYLRLGNYVFRLRGDAVTGVAYDNPGVRATGFSNLQIDLPTALLNRIHL